MKFELGKYYKHVAGRCIHIVSEGETDAFGKQWLVEETDLTGHSMSIMDAGSEDWQGRWIEIGREEWMFHFNDRVLKRRKKACENAVRLN